MSEVVYQVQNYHIFQILVKFAGLNDKFCLMDFNLSYGCY